MRSILLSCVLVLTLAASAHSKLLTADQVREVEPLLPYFTWLTDPEGKQTIASVASGSLQERFAPLANGVPLKAPGAVWLRLVVIKSPPTPSGGLARADRPRLVMHFGELPPGGAQMFISESPGPVSAQGVWHSETLTPHSDVPLPEPGLLPMSIYLRMDSMPSLWFAPTVSPQGSMRPDMLPSELLLPGLLLVAFAACLLRAAANRAQWAAWAALFLLCVLAQAVLPLPALGRNIAMRDLPAMLAPGMALVLLPHVGRCMFRTNAMSTLQDAILYLCSIIGVAVCLVPLAPGMSWLPRLFPLWPLLLFPLLPVCVSALANKRPGALSFAGACAMPLLGAILALYAIDMPSPHPLASQGSLWGLTLGGLGLALARIPRNNGAAQPREHDDKGLNLAGHGPDERHQPLVRGERPDAAPEHSGQTQYSALPSLEPRGAVKKQPLSMDISQINPQAHQQENNRAPAAAFASGAFLAEPDHQEEEKTEAESASGALPFHPEEIEPGRELPTENDPALQPMPQEPLGFEPSSPAQPAAWDESFEEQPAVQPVSVPETAPGHEATLWNPEDPAYPYTMVGGLSFGFSPPEQTQNETLNQDTNANGDAPLEDARPQAPATPINSTASLPESALPQEYSPLAQEAPAPATETEAPASDWNRFPAESTREEEPTAEEATEESPQPLTEASPYEAGLLPDFAGSSDIASPAVSDSRVISLIDEDFTAYSHPLLDDLPEESSRHTTLTSSGGFLFNLHALVREVHDIVVPLAKNKGLLFSWYITPSLPNLLEGDAPRLRGALSLLLQNAVQATQMGAVQLAVRRNPGGSAPGDLLFSISDSGSAQRTDAGFFHAWELAARTGGSFNVDYSPGGGTQITFTAHFALPSEEATREHLAGITRPVRWDDTTAALQSPLPSSAADLSPEDLEEQAEELQSRHDDTDRELDNAEPISLLWNRTSLPDPATEDLRSPHLPEEPEMAAMTPEQVLEQQDFLDPLPLLAAPASSQDPTRTGFRSQADLDQPGAVPLIVAAEMTNSKRKLLSHYLADLPHEHIDAASNSQVIALLRERPISLVIFDADMPEPDIINTLSALRQEEKKLRQRTAPVLALTNHEAQSQRMLKAGATHSLCKPFSREALRDVVIFALTSLFGAMASTSRTADKAGDPSPAGASGIPDRTGAEATASEGRISTVTGTRTEPPLHPFVAYIRSSGHREKSPAARYTDGLAEALAPASSPAPEAASAARQDSFQREEQNKTTAKPEPDRAAAEPARDATLGTQLGRPRQEVDLLEAALRDAPVQQGEPVLVPLPRLEEATEPRKAAPPSAAAPMVLGLSEDDVTPYSGQHTGPPLLDLIFTGNEEDDEDEQSTPATLERPGPVQAQEQVQSGHGQPDGSTSEVFAAGDTLAAPLPDDGRTGTPAPVLGEEPEVQPDVPTDAPPAPTPDTAADAPSATLEAAPQTESPHVPPASYPADAPVAPKTETEAPLSASSLNKPAPFAKEPAPVSEPGMPEAIAPGAAAGEPSAPQAVVEVPPAPDGDALPASGDAASPPGQPEAQVFPLPGLEGESLDMTLLPLLPGLIYALTDALDDARQGRDAGKTILVQEAASRLAGRAEVFGLQKLGRIGRCVERAAEADDMEAVSTLLEDLEIITKRYIDALQECFQAFISVDR